MGPRSRAASPMRSRPVLRRRLPDSWGSRPTGEARRDRLSYEAKDWQEIDQSARLPRRERPKQALVGSVGAGHGESHRLADRAAVSSVFHRDGMTWSDGGHREGDWGWTSGRNDVWRPRRIRRPPTYHRAVTRLPHEPCRPSRVCRYSVVSESQARLSPARSKTQSLPVNRDYYVSPASMYESVMARIRVKRKMHRQDLRTL